MKTAVIIGSGNIAHTFGHRLKSQNVDVVQVCARNKINGNSLAKEVGASFCSDIQNIKTDADLYLIAILDGAIAEVSAKMPKVSGSVIHTSGSTPLSSLSAKHRGVVWPLRSMRATEELDWSSVNLIIESHDSLAMTLGEILGGNCVEMTAAQRESAHMIAVISNNFVNHILHMADVLSEEAEIDRSLFEDLLINTFYKSRKMSPKDAQTGPAKRGDFDIINKQMTMLSEHPDFQDIYLSISESIIRTHHGEELQRDS